MVLLDFLEDSGVLVISFGFDVSFEKADSLFAFPLQIKSAGTFLMHSLCTIDKQQK